MDTENVAFALCQGRHEMPVEEAIFPHTLNPVDFEGMEQEAKSRLFPYKGKHIVVYVTGLTAALIAVLNVCREYHITVTLGHFNMAGGGYVFQEVK